MRGLYIHTDVKQVKKRVCKACRGAVFLFVTQFHLTSLSTQNLTYLELCYSRRIFIFCKFQYAPT